jgi:hypothetical protein
LNTAECSGRIGLDRNRVRGNGKDGKGRGRTGSEERQEWCGPDPFRGGKALLLAQYPEVLRCGDLSHGCSRRADV